MATLTVRNLEEDVRDKLRLRATLAGRSMEDEVRSILRSAVRGGSPRDVWRLSRELFADDDGSDLPIPNRTADRATPDFS